MEKRLVKRIWVKFEIIFALILIAICIFVHFGLFPLYIYRFRRSIESAYSYCRTLNLNAFLLEMQNDTALREAIIGRNMHYIVFDENKEILASDQTDPALALDSGDSVMIDEKAYTEDAKPVYENNALGEQIVLRGLLKSNGKPRYIAIYRRTALLQRSVSYTERTVISLSVILFAAASVLLYFLLKRGGSIIVQLEKELDALYENNYTERILVKGSVTEETRAARQLNELAERLYHGQKEVANYQYIIRNSAHNALEIEELRHDAVAHITHQLKTPLAIISSQVELELMETDEQKKEYYYQSIMEEVDKMSLLISEILRNVRDEHSGVPFLPRPVSVSDILKELSPKYESWLKSMGIVFISRIEPDVQVEADPVQFEHVVQNYMMNACKHTKKGKRIILTLKTGEGKAWILVRNDGQGIPESQLDKIWTSYYQGEGETSNLEMGLGLYIVRDIMRQHGGGYGVRNVEGGVEFYASFPMKGPGRMEDKRSGMPPEARKGSMPPEAQKDSKLSEVQKNSKLSEAQKN